MKVIVQVANTFFRSLHIGNIIIQTLIEQERIENTTLQGFLEEQQRVLNKQK